jgi:DNA polymerase III delta prime subunit
MKSIYNALCEDDGTVQRFIPVLFAGGEPSWIPLPLRGLTYYQIDIPEGYENLYRHLTIQPRYEIPVLGERKALPSIIPQSYPASLALPSTAQIPAGLHRRHRQQLLKQVHLDWIEGVLDQSLYKVARMELGFADRSDFVEHPLNTIVRIPDRTAHVISPGTPISQIFDEHGNALLILGTPGTGKTTLLLELARDLLLRAGQDIDLPMPVVFNLSSWALNRLPLRDWLIAELNERSYVAKKVARKWVESEQILPLLDGLDEVAIEHREACVIAINSFRREHGLLPIAICSRVADYQLLGTKLRLHRAIEVQPLARTQTENYLRHAGEPLRGLRAAAENDPSLWELLETPLMLWVAMLAYRDFSPGSTLNISLVQRRRQLFARFVEAMLQRRGAKEQFSGEQTRQWLSSLAGIMTKTGQTVVYLENLDFSWLPTRTQQWLARAVVMVTGGMPSGMLFGLGAGLLTLVASQHAEVPHLRQLAVLRAGLSVGLIGGFVCMLFGLANVTVLKVEPAEEIRFALVISLLGRVAVRAGLIFGLFLGLIFALIYGQNAGFTAGLSLGILIAFLCGPVFGLLIRFFGRLVQTLLPETKSEANSALAGPARRSIKLNRAWSLMIGFIGGSIVGMPFAIFGQGAGFVDTLIFIAFFGVIGAVSCAFLKIRQAKQDGFREEDMTGHGSEALRIGLTYVVIFGLFTMLLTNFFVDPGSSRVVGVITGVIFGLVGGMTRLLITMAVQETRSAVNEGTRQSVKMALVFSLVLGVIGGSIGRLLGATLPNRQFVSSLWVLGASLFCGLSLGLIGGLTSGGMFAIKHYVLRLFLNFSGAAPLKFSAFLADAKDALFLRQVGGGYIFVHRLLQEYFVSISEPK